MLSLVAHLFLVNWQNPNWLGIAVLLNAGVMGSSMILWVIADVFPLVSFHLAEAVLLL